MMITPHDLNLWIREGRSFIAIDLRQIDQRDEMPLVGIDHVIADASGIPESDQEMILICQYGLVTEGLILEKGLKNTYSLSGGVEAWNAFLADNLDISNWSRQVILEEVGTKGQRKLMNSRVGIIGMGGLGCPAAQSLIGAGVMNLSIIDGDVIEQSNLHRQMLYSANEVGLSKVTVAKEKLKKMNGKASIKIFNSYLDEENGHSFFRDLDVVIDATDNNTARRSIDKFSREYNVPMIYGGLYKYEGQVAVFNIKGSCSYAELFPSSKNNNENCNEAGMLGMLPGIIGNIQALEALKIIIGISPNLIGKLMIYDGMNHTTQTIRL